jgi:hypothetical protein
LFRAQLLHSPPCSEHDRAEAEFGPIEASTQRITVTNIPEVEIFISASYPFSEAAVCGPTDLYYGS